MRKLRFASTLLVCVATLGLGGCSWTFSPDAASGNSKYDSLDDDIQTGSIGTKDVTTALPQFKNLTDEDWRRAKAALDVALDPHGSKDRVVWDNPSTMAKGHFTSDGAPFLKNDDICRKFKATVTDQLETHNVQGTACRPSGGEWSIIDVAKPDKHTAVENKKKKA
ncbi:RT0821/Lpp0805 family surface protein [Microvirga sp. W0021]|uniref:RT0821/Lpp0805 family surface protein n=1 Tax=Hohaiivirga grylli TaxID=3133970 RepID=A0ABV0BH22_9HYPH